MSLSCVWVFFPIGDDSAEQSLRRHLASGAVRFFDNLDEPARDAQVIIVTVGSPTVPDGSSDISSLRSAMADLAKVEFSRWPTVVIRSAVPPGTTDQLAADAPWCDVVYVPELLDGKRAFSDFLQSDRIVVGCESPTAAIGYVRLLEALKRRVLFTSRCDAELIKCCSNAYLALKISFANEVANLCDSFGATADDVLRGIGYDHRIGSKFLKPGIGFGGPRFERDVKSMAHAAAKAGVSRELFAATLRVNDAQPKRIVELLQSEVGSLENATIGIWGLAFKAGTDDIRDSMALRIVEDLAIRGARTLVYDPAIHVAKLPRNSRLVSTALQAAHSDALLVLTDWPEFAMIDPNEYAKTISLGVVIDGRNRLDANRVVAAGLTYRGVGRPHGGRVSDNRQAAAI